MLTTLCLMSCVWGAGQSGERAEVLAGPQLVRGHEFLYRGTVREQSLAAGVQFNKTYQLETRALVLDVKQDGYDLAILTSLKPHGADKPGGDAGSVRLELAEVSPLGRLTPHSGNAPSLPLDGPPSWEVGFLIEVPRPLAGNQPWMVEENGRPPRHYVVLGVEAVGRTRCLKLAAEQKSADWDKPRADSTAWRRKETLWVDPRQGVACRLERELERRDPAHRDATYRISTHYELDAPLRFDGSSFEHRRQEILLIKQLQDKVLSILPEAVTHGRKPFEAVLARIDSHVKTNPSATPYREALLRVQRLAEAGKRGEVPPKLVDVKKDRLAAGKPAPEFVVTDLKSGQTVSLRRWQGKSILMVFYQQSSTLSPDALRHAQRVWEQHGDQELVVLGFAMGDDAQAANRLRDQLRLSFPNLSGKSLRISYDVEATPWFVVVDAEGVVRSTYAGWGPEIPGAIQDDLKECFVRQVQEKVRTGRP